ncbi:MAG: GrpB family protein [Candidatus Aenigmarchaeota archaeon]|nr:GrpB family protein [Candidatus Aenigmarchaeota archaeon]
MKKYVFRKYNPKYKNLFSYEKRKLSKILGSSVRIEHVGSTAVPGLGGKGIIDILIGVTNVKEIQKIKNKLKKNNYEFREIASTSTRLFFRKEYRYGGNIRRVHVHLTRIDSNDWKMMISFRDYLRKNYEIAKKYAEIKREAVKKARGNGEIYRKIKGMFIEKVLKSLN